MASAKTKDFDYLIENGSLELVSGPQEELAAQLFELVTNEGEWFLGPHFGYPWLVKDSKSNNIGLLGTVFNSGYISSILGEKLLASELVTSVESIELTFENGRLEGTIREVLKTDVQDTSNITDSVLSFSFGGDQ